tara:strand:- start:98 stop:478 length:381 start_codon:yes stop_codon:yes gene_type:complete
MPDRQPLFAEPLKQKVFVALKKAGLMTRDHFNWIMNLTDRESIQVLKKLGENIKPVAKEIGKGGLKMLGPLGAVYSLLESKPVASGELSPELMREQKLQQFQENVLNKKNGGIVSLNQMTRPIGYR